MWVATCCYSVGQEDKLFWGCFVCDPNRTQESFLEPRAGTYYFVCLFRILPWMTLAHKWLPKLPK